MSALKTQGETHSASKSLGAIVKVAYIRLSSRVGGLQVTVFVWEQGWRVWSLEVGVKEGEAVLIGLQWPKLIHRQKRKSQWGDFETELNRTKA